MQWIGRGGEQDPIAFGAAMQRHKEKEAKTARRFDCPVEFWSQHRADQLVAEWMRGTTLQARELAETNLDLFNEYLFLQNAADEAKPIQHEVAEHKAKLKGESQQTARDAARNPRNRQ